MGNQQINLLQHMLCSLISSGDIGLRGRRDGENKDEALSLLKMTEKNFFPCVKPDFM